ncbi:MAG: hypothetical protein A2Y03_00555 [Omnitrophica WOR_2 bacterium GWF2_38_59]|nr:MAG: hypothetical protein A2Y03_00555 [Omnitrophica WOR_2 bacterium GWF2_38_59]OGX49532.1 MAG: hypothetical protein A2243_10650 [Omnitrophica WOR_2 bacterium RIFOXYA2_FULL_38_17]OGX58728.1 MAG: hypothetical protein A2306_12275 [Omnitrophica WOR_2 bacterium RIFOXYB2_FULL_38_16]HBG62163.1 hypothetical protein [Candidatus Omnitrophota bacterium]
MWNDKESEIDLLGYRKLSNTVTSLIKDDRLSPLTIGIHGDWGAGKTSMVKFVETELKQDKKVLCLTFNGWLFEGYSDAKSVMMESIIIGLKESRPRNQKVKDAAVNLIRKVNWLKTVKRLGGLALTMTTGIPDPTLISEVLAKVKGGAEQLNIGEDEVSSLENYLKDKLLPENSDPLSKAIEGFREDFEKLIKLSKFERVVILVDDLDRCLPDTAIQTLEAIRLFLFVPKTAFILAVDEAMIEYAVYKHFPDLPTDVKSSRYKKNYLEKLIQVPLRIPPLNRTETQNYISCLLLEYVLQKESDKLGKLYDFIQQSQKLPWEEKVLDAKQATELFGELTEPVKEMLLLSQRIGAILAEGLEGNPRQIKRFLNTLMLRRMISDSLNISNDIDMHILAKLMLVERFKEKIYGDLISYAMQSKDGKVIQLKALEEHVKSGKDVDDKIQCPQHWLGDEWILKWVMIDKFLGEVDLRSYIHISREQALISSVSYGIRKELQSLINKLSSNSPLIISGLDKQLKILQPSDLEDIYEVLENSVRQQSTLQAKPAEMEGIYCLCKHSPTIQKRLVTLLKNMPVVDLGIWVLTGVETFLTDTEAKNEYGELKKSWASQQENAKLSQTIKATEKMSNN